MKLTARQEQVLNVIRQYIADTGYPPTRADISRELGFKSANAAEEHLRATRRRRRDRAFHRHFERTDRVHGGRCCLGLDGDHS